MDRMLKRTDNNFRVISLVLFLAAIYFIVGCNKTSAPSSDTTFNPQDGGTIQKEVLSKISRRVLSGITVDGRLKKIKERRVLRAALPPINPPFQDFDPELGIPSGFTPVLINEIALILDVKPNIIILDEIPDIPNSPADWEQKYDLLILPERTGGCRADHEVKFFFTGKESGWKTFCTAGDDPALTLAIKEILSYLNETGIFARLYQTYVRP